MLCRHAVAGHRRLGAVAGLGIVAVLMWHVESPSAQPSYTVAFKSFAPNNTDIFSADGNGQEARPLAPHPMLDYNASFSADGRWIVFTSHRSGSGKIYRVRPDGSGLERLTDGPTFDDQASLSPDGTSLAFVSTRTGQADIWVFDLPTRALRNVTSNSAGDFRPAWSPDGKWIAFSSDRDPARGPCPNTTAPGPAPFVTPQYLGVYIVQGDGSGLRRITAPGEIAGTPHWSPDATHLGFWAGEPEQVCQGGLIFGTGTTQIVSVNVASGARQTMTSGDGLKVFPRWVTPSRVAYQTRGGIRFADGAASDGDFLSPDWSADGRSMIFHRETDPRGDRDRPFQSWGSLDSQFALMRVPDTGSFRATGDRMVYLLTNFTGPVRNGALVVSNADGSDRRAIYEGPLTQDMVGPAWAPGTDTIAFGAGGFFQRAQIQSAKLMTIGADGSGLVPLTIEEGVNDGMPSWSPDGRQIVFRRADGTKRRLYILDVRTRATRRLETGSDLDTFPTWSPRGDWIAFTSNRDGDYEIYRIRPDGTDVQRLTRSPGNDAHPSFSPEGDWIAFATARQGFKDEAVQLLLSATFQPYGEIAVMHADGSDVRLLTDNSTEEGTPFWVPRGRR